DPTADKENEFPGKRPRSPSLKFSEHKLIDGSPIKNLPVKKAKKFLPHRIACPELGIFATSPLADVPQTPVPPYHQTPAPVTVSQMYMYRLIGDCWDAKIKRCKEAKKAHLLEVQLAAHGIRKLV
ncbi:hypothetical protein BDR07DRAFT_1423333, partial [Suillus spraguei]